MIKLKIGYFADGEWSHTALKNFNSDPSVEVAFVCSRFNKKDEILKEICQLNKIPFFSHPNINSKDFLDSIKECNCNLFISMAFNQIFKKDILDIPMLGTINCHAGKLPFYRGCNVLNWVLINDEKEFGITVHYVDLGIDTGDIIVQKLFPITDSDTYESLLQIAYANCPKLLIEAVKLIQNRSVNAIKQSSIDSIGYYCRRRKEGDEIINWNSNSREIFNLVRAISSPGPCCKSFIEDVPIKIKKVVIEEHVRINKEIPGTILKVENDNFIVKTQDSHLRVIEFECNYELKVGDKLN